MKHHATASFWNAYAALPAQIRSLADRNFELLKSNPQHPSLHFKAVGRYWSARIGISYRVLAIRDKDDWVWFWIGSHAEYDRLIER